MELGTAAPRTVSAEQVAELRRQDPSLVLIDVRTPAEYREVHADGAELMPLDSLDPKVLASRCDPNEPAYLICKSGQRAAEAAEKCSASGFPDVIVVAGGTAAWEEAGLPVIRGKKTISLERQVRIAAGLLVLLGVALGHWVHPAFLILSGFVGAGLAFAGITDTCGMAMVLAKIPWNQ